MSKGINSKEIARLREKPIKNDCKSLYLDIYYKGKRQYEFLNLYLVPEKTATDKLQNKETLRTAQAIKAQRIIDLNNCNNDLTNNQLVRANFFDFATKIADIKKELTGERGTCMSYYATIRQIKQFVGSEILPFKDINKDFCVRFIEYLKTAKSTIHPTENITGHTQLLYVRNFQTLLNRAVKEDINTKNYFQQIDKELKPRKHEVDIKYLTAEEVKQIELLEFDNNIKKPFLFSCYTGLRYSDIKALKWENIKLTENLILLQLKTKKTSKNQYLPLNQKALELLPDRKTDNDFIFDLPANSYSNVVLRNVTANVIKKRVTFHVARHTHATLLLNKGVSIETVSEILGHSNVATTQIYAKIMGSTIKYAIDKLNDL